MRQDLRIIQMSMSLRWSTTRRSTLLSLGAIFGVAFFGPRNVAAQQEAPLQVDLPRFRGRVSSEVLQAVPIPGERKASPAERGSRPLGRAGSSLIRPYTQDSASKSATAPVSGGLREQCYQSNSRRATGSVRRTFALEPDARCQTQGYRNRAELRLRCVMQSLRTPSQEVA